MLAQRPRLRRIVFGAFTLVLVAAAIEVLGLGAYLVQRHQWFSYAKVHALQAEFGNPEDSIVKRQAVDWSRPLVVHPYLGFAFDPDSDAAAEDVPWGLENDPYGFQTAASPVQKRAPDKVIIALTGGSVAYFLSSAGRGALITELSKSPAVKGKRVELVTLALPGYKQPQQLLALTWFLVLGGEFDIVINLDGFNELALSSSENLDADVFPYYPRSWHVLSGQIDDRPLLSTVARMAVEREERHLQANAMSTSWLRWSIAANAVWSLRDAIHGKEIARLEREIRAQTSRRPRSYLRNGPPRPLYRDERQRFADIAQFWKRASLEMARLAQPNGFRYFHFLQANQYDLGSKTLTADEREHAYSERTEYRPPIEKGYPFLRAAGAELVAEGVAFHDLSRMFADRSDTIYVDDCCHYQELGYRLMGARIGKIVAEALDRGRK